MALLSVQQVRTSFGGPPLLDSVSLHIEAGERVCLLGRNGAGKSSLMRCIAGELVPDGGRIVRQQDLRVSFLPQEVPQGLDGRVFELAAAGLGKLGHTLAAYQQLSAELAHRHGNSQLLARLDRLQHSLDMDGGWLVHRQVEQILSHLDLDPNAPFASLSGGLKRRTLLAVALVSDPDLLLLDEPTNDLDVDTLRALEDAVVEFAGCAVVVSHDRWFLDRIATHIIAFEGDSEVVWFAGNYADYEADRRRRLGRAADQPHRIRFRKLTRA
jgi:ATP-binding cassette subfamily F protein uup